jgi:cytoskeletal protein CcmA (bactofilin family)
MVIGDIYAPRLIAEEGVIIDGTLAIRGEGEAPRVDEASMRRNFTLAGSGRSPDRGVEQAARSPVSRLSSR